MSSAYVLVLRLDTEVCVTVGALGELLFLPGTYFYVGSAKRNLEARLQRHLAPRKRLRWHIDYLTTNQLFSVAGALVAPADVTECQISRFLATRFRWVARGFGASDCQWRCKSHLYFSPQEHDEQDLRNLLPDWKAFTGRKNWTN